MSTLEEIETAAGLLTPEQQQELFLFLATRLRAGNTRKPATRDLPRERIESWIEDDNQGMQRLRGR